MRFTGFSISVEYDGGKMKQYGGGMFKSVIPVIFHGIYIVKQG